MKNYLSKIKVIFLFVFSLGFLSSGKGEAGLFPGYVKFGDSITRHEENNAGGFYLPVIFNENNKANIIRRINLPYFGTSNPQDRYAELAVAWFGSVGSIDNYADVRVGYNDEELFISLNIFDRILWYDKDPSLDDMTNWDAVTILLDRDDNARANPGISSYQFVAALNHWEPRVDYQVSYEGNGAGWDVVPIQFYTTTIYRGEGGLNNGEENRGWQVNYEIPFASLGLTSPPPDGSRWKFGILLHDRDDADGTFIEPKTWPEMVDQNNPGSWGGLHFGLVRFDTPPVSKSGELVVRNKLEGVTVQDVAVGGTISNLCPGDSYHIWNVWGNANYANAPDINIQNQADVSDWPCFSKYYLNFQLDNVPDGKVIISAKLILYQFGNAGDINDPDPRNRPHPSLIQVLRVNEEWSEMTLSWNNAPLAYENISQTWVDPIVEFPGWPGLAREWDVSYGVEQSYLADQPFNIVLYEADISQHSGKYFSSSDAGDWDENGRPTLVVSWGDP